MPTLIALSFPDPDPTAHLAWTRVLLRLDLAHLRLFNGFGGKSRPRPLGELRDEAAGWLDTIRATMAVKIKDRKERREFMRGLEEIVAEELAGIDGRAT